MTTPTRTDEQQVPATTWHVEPPEEEGHPRPAPCVIVVFGATGDLAARDLLPALYELELRDLLPRRYAILGSGRTQMSDDEFRRMTHEAVADRDDFAEGSWRSFAKRLHYASADSAQALEPGGWKSLSRCMDDLREDLDLPQNTLFHLAVPPSTFGDIAARLGELGETHDDRCWKRLAVEKPFGEDEESARALDSELREHFRPDSIFRVDHYLGKETVQNLLVTRFANPGFEPIWNRNYVDHVQITAAESIGIDGRGSFYDHTGVIRDMMQNHVLQLLCFVAAEPPVRCIGESLRDETTRVLQSIRRPDPACDLVIGQYDEGVVDGREVAAYRDEKNVDSDSTTPTFAALRLELDSWRWAGVPFYLRTGKRLGRKITEISIHFRPTPQAMFPDQHTFRSSLTFRLQPDEAVVQSIAAKQPGPQLSIQPVRMSFSYSDAFGLDRPPSAYAWLLHDALLGNQTLFANSDWIYRSWSLIDPLTASAEGFGAPALLPYHAGSWGPRAARELLGREGREWSLT